MRCTAAENKPFAESTWQGSWPNSNIWQKLRTDRYHPFENVLCPKGKGFTHLDQFETHCINSNPILKLNKTEINRSHSQRFHAVGLQRLLPGAVHLGAAGQEEAELRAPQCHASSASRGSCPRCWLGLSAPSCFAGATKQDDSSGRDVRFDLGNLVKSSRCSARHKLTVEHRSGRLRSCYQKLQLAINSPVLSTGWDFHQNLE